VDAEIVGGVVMRRTFLAVVVAVMAVLASATVAVAKPPDVKRRSCGAP
jgi:hypothetical protein